MTTDTDQSIRTDWGQFTEAHPTPTTVDLSANTAPSLSAAEFGALVNRYVQYITASGMKSHRRKEIELDLRMVQAALGNERFTCENLLRSLRKAFAHYSPGMQKECRAKVRGWEIWCNRSGFISTNWVLMHKTPKVPDTKRVPVTYAEYQALLGAIDHPRASYLLRVCWMTGFAMCDACMLEWSQVDLREMVIKKTREKTGTPCLVPILHGSPLHLMLEERFRTRLDHVGHYPSINGRLYVDNESAGLYMKKQSWRSQEVLTKTCKALGFGRTIHWHDFRATFCSAAMAVSDPITVSNVSGHTDPKSLEHYATPSLDKVRDMSERADRWIKNGGKL
jgi:integrase